MTANTDLTKRSIETRRIRKIELPSTPFIAFYKKLHDLGLVEVEVCEGEGENEVIAEIELLKTCYEDYLQKTFKDEINENNITDFYNVKKIKPFLKHYHKIRLEISEDYKKRIIQNKIDVGLINERSEEQVKESKDKLTHKQQILLLKQVGFFELPIFQKLTTQQKGKLVSHLLNRTEKDSLELIRGMNGKPVKPYILKTKENIEKVNKLLSEIGLSEHLVK